VEAGCFLEEVGGGGAKPVGDCFCLINQQNTVICIAHQQLKNIAMRCVSRAQNAFVAGALPRTPLGDLAVLPRAGWTFLAVEGKEGGKEGGCKGWFSLG